MEHVEEFLCTHRHALWTRQMSVLAEMDEINCEKLKVLGFVVLVCMSYQCPDQCSLIVRKVW